MRRFIFFTLCYSPLLLLANPKGAHVVSGEVVLQSCHSDLLEIQTSDHAIIEWSDFSIEKGETTRFSMPSKDSVVLNRVCELAPSHLLGRLESNGQFILINPNGVLVGKEAVIDTASFIASTLDLQNDHFLANKELKFIGDSEAEIQNRGAIRSDYAVLIGRHVHNPGSIEIPSGTAALLAGGEVTISPNSEAPFTLRTHGTNGQFTAATIEGSIKAEGGTVCIMGDRIWLKDGSSIDVSSDLNGGTVLIGGDFQGKNPHFQNAEYLVLEKNARILADSRIEGNGGKVILWADRSNIAYGSISAKGGLRNGNGGFAEISADSLVFDGAVDLSSPFGSPGRLYLDPTDILIAAATCGTVAIGPITTWTALCGCPVNISGAAIAAVLAGGTNVSIDTATLPNLACGGNGSITVTSAINWGSAANLTLTASGNVTINANIQNSGTGNVTVNTTGGSLQIAPPIVATNVSVGSQNGTTCIDAPNANVTVQAAPNFVSQIGFFAGSVTSTGPIKVNCGTLTLLGNNGNSAAQIGHGRSNVLSGANNNSVTTNAATIDICANGNILVDSNGTGRTFALIGHGSRSANGLANQAGDIAVVSRTGSITLTNGGLNGLTAFARIGHGFLDAGGFLSDYNGDITVRAPLGDINILSNVPNNACFAFIGHGGGVTFGFNSVTSDIYVACGGDIFLDAFAPTINQRVAIGAVYSVPTPTVTQNIRVLAGGDITLRSTQRTYIGNYFQTGGGAVSCVGDVEVVAGGTLTLTTQNSEVLVGTTFAPAVVGVTLNSNVFVAAGQDILISTPPGGPSKVAIIESGHNLSVAAGRDIIIISGQSGQDVSIGTANRNGGGAAVRIYAGRDVLANNALGGRANLGFDASDFLSNSIYSVDIRAGSDIQMANGFQGTTSTQSGNIFIEADSCFATGALWGYSPDAAASVCGNTFSCTAAPSLCQCTFIQSFMTSICGSPFQATLPIVETNLLPPPTVPITICNAAPVPINQTSLNQCADGIGAFRVVTSLAPINNVTFQTTTGNITVHSGPVSFDSGLAQNLLIGASPNNLNISTPNGAIDISGASCRCQDGFDSIFFNTVGGLSTSGSIYGRAANNLNVNTAIFTTGAASPITLISDCNQTGGGNVNLAANVTTINGALTINAGVLDASCTAGFCTRSLGTSASIIQTAGAVSSTTGSILLLAQNNIQLNPVPIPAFCITSSSGTISGYAGNDITIGVNQDIRTAAAISFVAGHSMTLSAGATIQSTAGSVTIVVDDDFPTCPFNGNRSSIGSLTTASTSSISGAPLLIFTALQSLNQIDGLLNAALFVPGTLYTDTSSEIWCSFFGCPSSFSSCSGTAFAPGLGNPFTIFYKDCLQQATQQATLIVDQLLVSLHPFDEFPGWISEFFIFTNISQFSFKDPYFIRRRLLNAINQPKSWTALLNEGSFYDEQLDR